MRSKGGIETVALIEAIEFVNEIQLAKALVVSVQTVRRWRATWNGKELGTGPRPYKFGKSVRYRISEVQAWVLGNRQGTADAVPVRQGNLAAGA
jgi:predicted DNA-binding transcriptional regulator AlpA